MKVFSLLSLKRNLENFNLCRDRQHSSPCMALCATLRTRYTGVEYCLFAQGLPESPADKRNAPHFLYVITVHGAGREEYFNLKHTIMDNKKKNMAYDRPEVEIIILKTGSPILGGSNTGNPWETNPED